MYYLLKKSNDTVITEPWSQRTEAIGPEADTQVQETAEPWAQRSEPKAT